MTINLLKEKIDLYPEDFTQEEKELINKVSDEIVTLSLERVNDQEDNSEDLKKAMRLLIRKGYAYDLLLDEENNELIYIPLSKNDLSKIRTLMMIAVNESKKNNEIFTDLYNKFTEIEYVSRGLVEE